MCNSSRSGDNGSRFCKNSMLKLYADSRENFAVLSFNDLANLGSSPCFCENLSLSLKSPPVKMLNTDLEHDTISGVDTYLLDTSVARLSPGLECNFGQISPGLELENWFFGSTSINKDFNFSEDFVDSPPSLLGDEVLGSKDKPGFILDSEDSETTHTQNTLGEYATWLSKTAVATESLTFSGSNSTTSETTVSATPVINTGSQVPHEALIPSLVQDNIFIDAEEDLADCQPESVSPEKQTSSSRSRKRQRQNVQPGTEEYKKKRELNNLSVRKSREKARKKQQVTEERVEILSAENDRLQSRVDSLEKEVNVLKGLFSSIGAALPPEMISLLSPE